MSALRPDPDTPLLSVVTTAYKSAHRILRPYTSLRAQTYNNWEWIVVVDDDSEDGNFTLITELAARDIRIRACRQTHHSGSIGTMKAMGNSLARGQWILELDHDDDIVPELLDWVVRAARDHPDVGFIYSDFTEMHEKTFAPFLYSGAYGHEHGTAFMTRYKGNWQYVQQAIPINAVTIRHIVGVPNHIRCWRADVYRAVGGSSRELSVADDYELIIRTVLHTKWLRIAELAYVQYRNANGNNFTFIRNALIQVLVARIQQHYEPQLVQRFGQSMRDVHNRPGVWTLPDFQPRGDHLES